MEGEMVNYRGKGHLLSDEWEKRLKEEKEKQVRVNYRDGGGVLKIMDMEARGEKPDVVVEMEAARGGVWNWSKVMEHKRKRWEEFLQSDRDVKRRVVDGLLRGQVLAVNMHGELVRWHEMEKVEDLPAVITRLERHGNHSFLGLEMEEMQRWVRECVGGDGGGPPPHSGVGALVTSGVSQLHERQVGGGTHEQPQ